MRTPFLLFYNKALFANYVSSLLKTQLSLLKPIVSLEAQEKRELHDTGLKDSLTVYSFRILRVCLCVRRKRISVNGQIRRNARRKKLYSLNRSHSSWEHVGRYQRWKECKRQQNESTQTCNRMPLKCSSFLRAARDFIKNV